MLQISQNDKNINCYSEEAAINLVENVPGGTPIIVDFDETLLLRNSTEEYLNSLQPRIIGKFVLTLLNFLKPWNWLPDAIKGDFSRDWMRVLIATIFLPWTLIIWQWKAKTLAHNYENKALIKALENRKDCPIIIGTLGFDLIVYPIIKHLSLEINRVISCRFWQGGIDRVKGKLQMVTDSLDKDAVTNSLVITDSNDDETLLLSASHPCLLVWHEAQYIPAMSDIYIPLVYTEKVKKPGDQYLFKTIIKDDLLMLVMASTWLSHQPLLHFASMTLLMFSFWCIYEIGYMENDLIAEKFEKSPQLTANYQKYKPIINLWQPWIWSSILAIPGIVLLELTTIIHNDDFIFGFNQLDLSKILTKIGLWFGLLLLLRATYWVYNRVDKQTRDWLFPCLQVYKCFGFLVITTTNIVGSMLFAAQVLSRWLPYIIYRYAKVGNWTANVGHLFTNLFRCVIFTFLLIAASLGNQDTSLLISWQSLCIFVYCAWRGRKQFREIIHQAHPIKQDDWQAHQIS